MNAMDMAQLINAAANGGIALTVCLVMLLQIRPAIDKLTEAVHELRTGQAQAQAATTDKIAEVTREQTRAFAELTASLHHTNGRVP